VQGLKGNNKANHMLLFAETGGLKSIIEEKKREQTLADQAVIDAILERIDEWNVKDKNNDE
jgi:hypothetical protein